MRVVILAGFILIFGIGCQFHKASTPASSPTPDIKEETTLEQTKVSVEEMFLKEENPKRKASLEKVVQGSRLLNHSVARARELFARAMALDPTNPMAYYFLGLASYEQGKWEEGVRYFKRAADGFENDESDLWHQESCDRVKEGLLKLGREE